MTTSGRLIGVGTGPGDPELLTIKAVRSHIQVWINGVLTSTYDTATRNGRTGYIGLENAGNNLMYRSVRIKELAPDTVAPTVTVDVPAVLPLGNNLTDTVVKRHVKRRGSGKPFRLAQIEIAGNIVNLAFDRHGRRRFRRPVAIIDQTRKPLMDERGIEIRARRSGLMPDFTPPRLVKVVALVEAVVERVPGLNIFCAHNVVVARKPAP